MSKSFIPTDYSQIQKKIDETKGGTFWGGYYAPGVYGVTPTQKKQFTGRILPAFDYDLSEADIEFNTSFIPYRNENNVDPQTGQPVFNAFFAVIASYSFFGQQSVSFLSPTTRRFTHGIDRGPEVIDPVLDIRNFAKKSEDPTIRALTERMENKKDARIVLPYPQRRYVFNFEGTHSLDKTRRNYLIDVPQKGFEDLNGKLSEWRPAHEATVDPMWPNYLFGDITHPKTGLQVYTASIPSTPQPFNGFVIADGMHKSLKGTVQVPVSHEGLAGRYRMYGDNSVFKFFSAQEIVEFLVADGLVPYHLIERVCSAYATVPPEPKKNTGYSHGSEEDGDDYVPGLPPIPVKPAARAPEPTPRPSAPTPAAPQPTPAPAPVAVKVWVSVDSEISSDVMSLPDAQIYISDAPYTASIFVCEQGSSEWKSPSAFGIVPPEKPKPAAPPAVASAPPPAPPAPAPVAPAPPAPPAPTGGDSDEMAEFTMLQAKFQANTISPSEIQKFLELSKKLGQS